MNILLGKFFQVIVFLWFLLIFSLSGYKIQAQTGSEIDIKQQTIRNLSSQGDVNNAAYIRDIPIPEEAMTGDFNLYDSYYPADITFYDNNQINGVDIKYDLFNNYLNFERKGEIRTITGSIVKEFTLYGPNGEELYLNARNMQVPFKGFFRVVIKHENIELYQYKDAKVKDPTYHLAMDVGERAPQAVIKDIYLVKTTLGFQKIKNLKKKGMEVFGKHASEMYSYVKAEKLKYSRLEDMKKLATHYAEVVN
jgi:hypothetical protein